MTQEDFNDQMGDILSSGQFGFEDWHRDELKNLFEGMDKNILADWLDTFYNQPYGLEEGVSGEELNWVAEYLGKKAYVRFK